MNRIKNYIEDVILAVKNKFTSSKYIVKGKCKQCGKCCENILFSDQNGYIKNEQDFAKMQREKAIYRNFYPNGKITGEGEELEGVITFKCRFLKDKKCSIYFFRPAFCRDYPSVNKKFIEMGGVTLDDCGFRFEPDKSFKEYLKN